MEKLPPLEKVYEAWSAIADGRIEFRKDEPEKARIESSDGSKSYTVIYDPKTDTYASDDNATFWRGYAGYPVIAVMMLQGLLPLDKDELPLWKAINWTELNKQYKRDYAEAVRHVEEERGIDPNKAREAAEKVMSALKSLQSRTRRLKKSEQSH